MAGWIFDKIGAPDNPILLGIGLFAGVLPAAMLFRVIKSRPVTTPKQETA